MLPERPSSSTADGMSERDPRTYGNIVIVGGGCYGSYYVRQLQRASAAGAILYDRITVVDRDPRCAISAIAPPIELVTAEWSAFFDEYLSSETTESTDAIVPSPLMPHLMYQWLVSRARARWPHRDVKTLPLAHQPGTPWESAAPDGTHYVSYATWQCPINCIEPRLCPHTRGERDWTMPEMAKQLVARSTQSDGAVLGPVIFHCTHRAFGVGMFDTRDVVAANEFVSTAAAESAADVLVGTVSHCHGALNVLHVGAQPA